ncbi:MAG: hypothetical protein H7Y07_07115 [Pyrinomonadaceae bacterium]|nr:hypothetical protein [Sphingobacteriaceae bacterium]
MKQSTKVLLPLGLFMSVVIPIAVKSMFSESDFFESGGSDIQLYKPQPENATNLPTLRVGENGLQVEIIEASTATVPVEVTRPANTNKSSYESKKFDVSVSADLKNTIN